MLRGEFEPFVEPLFVSLLRQVLINVKVGHLLTISLLVNSSTLFRLFLCVIDWHYPLIFLFLVCFCFIYKILADSANLCARYIIQSTVSPKLINR